MKIVAVMGSCRKNGAGAHIVKLVEEAAKKAYGPGLDFETIWLGDCDLKLCKGCMACYEKGEAACPLKDGYLDAIHMLDTADAAVFYSPTYTLSVSGLMKTFFDRSSWVLHRPHFKGRYALALTAVESFGEKQALDTLKTIVPMMGFRLAGGMGVVNLKYHKDHRYAARVERRVSKCAHKLVALARPGKAYRPSFFELLVFHFQKKVFGSDTPGCKNDKRRWREYGWADRNARFYCEARIPAWKSWLARAITVTARKLGAVPE